MQPLESVQASTVAVVLCTANRSLSLVATLETVWRQTAPPNELIIVDDGQLADDIRQDVAARCEALGIAFQHHRKATPGLTASRNLAAAQATSEVLLYLDDDVECEPTLVARVREIMRDPAVGGVSITVREPTFESRSARVYQFGYRVALWWRIHPRQRPTGPVPRAVGDSSCTVARWLCGAAMALRTTMVRRHPFDESLSNYALGEDREFGYRVGPHYWLLQTRDCLVTHRREPSQRTNSRRLGFMTSFNYLYILHKTCRIGFAEQVQIAWSFLVLGAMHLVWGLRPGARWHWQELRGMVDGVVAFERVPLLCEQCEDSVHSAGKKAGEPLRVLFVTNRLEPGGAEHLLVSLIRHFDRQRIMPSVLCLKDEGPLAAGLRATDVPIFDRVLASKFDTSAIPRIRKILHDENIDVLVVAHSGGDRMFWSTLAGAAQGVPIVVWSHWFPGPEARHFERANRLLFRKVDRYIALGNLHRDALIRYEHLPSGRISVIANGIDPSPFERAASRESVRAELKLDDEDIAVGIIANLRPEKRHDVFIAAARVLAPQNARYRFLIIGDGPGAHDVRTAAINSGVSPDVLRLVGPRDDIAAVLRGLDMCVLCSQKECFSVVMLEAALAGCPFVGPHTGSMSEFLIDHETGLAVRPADAASLVGAIAELAAKPELRQRIALAAKQKALASFTVQTMTAAITDLLYRVARP